MTRNVLLSSQKAPATFNPRRLILLEHCREGNRSKDCRCWQQDRRRKKKRKVAIGGKRERGKKSAVAVGSSEPKTLLKYINTSIILYLDLISNDEDWTE